MATHTCPGKGCQIQVPRHQLACRSCWFKVPAPLRRAINETYRNRSKNPDAHSANIREAIRLLNDTGN